MVIFYEVKKVEGTNPVFFEFSKKLEAFQFGLMPILKEKGYSLTDNLDEVTGFILHINSEPVGSIGLKKIDETTCEIVRVFIDEKYRGKGHARLLFEYAENYAKELGFKKAEMVAWCKATSALALYKKLGYTFSEEKESEWFECLRYVELSKDL